MNKNFHLVFFMIMTIILSSVLMAEPITWRDITIIIDVVGMTLMAISFYLAKR